MTREGRASRSGKSTPLVAALWGSASPPASWSLTPIFNRRHSTCCANERSPNRPGEPDRLGARTHRCAAENLPPSYLSARPHSRALAASLIALDLRRRTAPPLGSKPPTTAKHAHADLRIWRKRRGKPHRPASKATSRATCEAFIFGTRLMTVGRTRAWVAQSELIYRELGTIPHRSVMRLLRANQSVV